MRLNLPPGLHHQLQLRLLLPLRLQLVGELPLQRHLLAQRRLLSLEVLVQCVRIGRPRRSGGASGVGRRVKGGGRGGPRYGARAAAPLHPRRLGGPRLAVAVAGPRRALVHHAAVLLEVRLDVCLGEAVDVHQLEDGLWLGVVEAELVARRLELRVQRWGPNEAWPGLLVQLGNRRRRRERWRKGGRLDRNVAVGGEPPWHDVLCAEQAVPAVRLPKHCVHRHRLPERGGAARENGLDDGRNRRRAPLRGRVDGGSHGVEDVAGH
mmetsp:Transcript_40276/g.130345  ORF Transcript_40276/g.130345 Transcript_40276/m.130345 type:complete len:265 (+) Transcript_40276:537-1331(+)